jgi:hypothetical protein
MDGLAEEAARLLVSWRVEMLKDIFVTQYDIATDRLYLCEPELDKATEAIPRLELRL